MFNSLEGKCIEQIDTTKNVLQTLESIVEQNPLRRKEIRRFIVSSCVTRLYAIYEYFVDTVLADYLDILAECIPYAGLSEEFKREYRNGISHLLGKIEYAQYSSLIPEDIIKWYYEALTNQPNYRFVTKALVIHEQNLRLNIVEQLFSKVQLKDFRNWINRHKLIKGLYADQESIYEQLESELKNFVQLRNDASHGNLDDLEGKDNLLRFCELISTLIKVFTSFIRRSTLLHQVNVGKAYEIGQISEVFRKSRACILIPLKGVKFRVGNECCLVSNSDCFESNIISMMIEGNNVSSFSAKVDELEIGVQYDTEVMKQTKVFMYK